VPGQHVVVDGSNIATEGRVMPSLAQLEEAVAEYQKEYPDDELVIVVDATFGHRIDESERPRFDDAIAHNEMVSPPAGAIGRGDAFLLRIADKVGATVLSNDSFQEFHGEYDWLFNNGRLIGGKPVPGIGWIFTPRTPVRGPKSRMAVADARKAGRSTSKASEPQRGRGRQAASKPVEEQPDREQARPQRVREQQKVSKAIEVATDEGPRTATRFSTAPSGLSPPMKRWTVKPSGASAASSTSNTAPLAGVTLGTAISRWANSTGSIGTVMVAGVARRARCRKPIFPRSRKPTAPATPRH